jgi:hypothetical protein
MNVDVVTCRSCCGVAEGFRRCAYCTKIACTDKPDCGSLCAVCGDFFCRFCATLNYDLSFERMLCLDCNSG